jgi:predicted ATPase
MFNNNNSEYDVNILIGENGSGKSFFLNDFAKYSIRENKNVIAIATSVHDKFNIRNSKFHFYGARQGRNMISKVIKKSLMSTEEQAEDKIRNFIRVLDYIGYSSRMGIQINGFNRDKVRLLEIDGVIEISNKYDLLSLLNKYHEMLLNNQIVSVDLYAFTSGNINSSAFGALLKFEAIMKKLGILREITLYLEKDNQNISLQNASSGELLILSTLTFISSYIEPNSTILIDEPENSLHPKWQKEYIGKILDMFYYYHPKIIIATHSALMIPLKEQPINLFSIENSIIKKLKRTTNNNEELLSDTFKIVTPENRYLSNHRLD